MSTIQSTDRARHTSVPVPYSRTHGWSLVKLRPFADLYGEFQDVRASIRSESGARSVDTDLAQAMGYAWGRQDAGDGPKDSAAAWRFAYAYGLHTAWYRAEWRGSRAPLVDAWREWTRTGAVTGAYLPD
jgi:hypothetical protein